MESLSVVGEDHSAISCSLDHAQPFAIVENVAYPSAVAKHGLATMTIDQLAEDIGTAAIVVIGKVVMKAFAVESEFSQDRIHMAYSFPL